jgi:AAA15 family ATPase/GTPase
MLIRFNVGNFLSFNEIQEFSMISGKVKSKTDHVMDVNGMGLLKFGAVFGANASGKSNLIKAIDFARSTIVNGLDSGFVNSYFRLEDANIEKPSYFEFEIKIDAKFYAYGFEILLHKNEIVSEWLHEISAKKNVIIFERDLTKNEYRTEIKANNKNVEKKMEVYSDDLKSQPNLLFLNEMNRNKEELYKEPSVLTALRDVYLWFELNLDINYPERPVSGYSYFFDEKDTAKTCKIINAFGTGITNFTITDSSIEEVANALPKQLRERLENDIKKKMINRNKKNEVVAIIRSDENLFIISINERLEIEIKTVVFEHEKPGTIFKFAEESDGTRRILDLIEILLMDNGKVYVIDEIDRSLHPQLTYKFIATFLSKLSNSTSQLIVTTHESRLLDFDLLRRDEIWFVDKNKQGESSLYSLEMYNERFDKKIDKAYLEGRYGGVPIFSTVFPVKEEAPCD